MASTRYSKQQPLQIYQDPVFDQVPMSTMMSTSHSTGPLQTVKNAAPNRQIVFNAPSSSPKPSPKKSASQTSSSPLRAPFSNKLNMVNMPPPAAPNFSTDSMEKRLSTLHKFKSGPQKALFTTFPSSRSTGKENAQPATIYPAPSPIADGFSGVSFAPMDNIYGMKQHRKRVLMDAAPVEESRSKKLKENTPAVTEPVVPAHDEFPPIHDDGTKPPHSYAMLIGMSILRAPARRLTLAQIYKWISDNFSFYNASEAGWQNSIRHNLSLNKAFIKQERPKDDPGKGNYWAIEPGMEHLFIKDKHTRKSTTYGENQHSSSSSGLSQEKYKMPTPGPGQVELPRPSTAPMSYESLPKAKEPSSDATIPASDSYIPEELQDDSYVLPASQAIHSSPPPAMHSSPPIAHVQDRDNTPPPVPRFPTSSRTRSHQRKFASMDDSGYFSSLESSAMRPPRTGRLFTSEADRPRMKRGRAEEEIARLRQSSYDSPTKTRGFMGNSTALSAIQSSSPIRRGLASEASQMLPPLTPAVKLKAPERPPPSVSPNTNLKLHRDRVRELVGSPARGIASLDESIPWSPAFHLDNDIVFGDFSGTFDIFADNTVDLLPMPGNGSPTKRSKASIERPRSTNVLGEISTPNLNKSVTSSAKRRSAMPMAIPELESPGKLFAFESPCKFTPSSLNTAGFELPQEDFYGTEFLSEDFADFSGMDILQGFQKIGAGQSSRTNGNAKGGPRPGLGRSFTTQF